MATVEPKVTRTITTTAEFHEAITTTWSSHFLFRGENSTQFPLLSRIGRQIVRNNKNAGVEKGMLREFKRRSTPLVTHRPSSDWEWLAVAQHFGLATRLLDWSENPLVAAFFAVHNDAPNDVVLYALDEGEIAQAHEDTSPFAIEQVAIYRPPHISPRISAQAGAFTCHPKPQEEFSSPHLQRWVIKRTLVVNLRITLDLYGVHPASIYPDLQGLADHVHRSWIRPPEKKQPASAGAPRE